MEYYLDEVINEISNDKTLIIEVIGYDEFVLKYHDMYHGINMQHHLNDVKHCRVDLYYDGYNGIMGVLDKKLLKNYHSFGFCLNDNKLILIDDENIVRGLIEQIKPEYYNKHISLSCFLHYLIVKIIENDGLYLQKYLQKLELIEDQIDSNFNEKISKSIMSIRKNLLSISSYYSQLGDMVDVFCDNESDFLNTYECHLFNMLARRIDRLERQIAALRDYSMQVREMYQNKIDMHQNRVMTLLTVATSLFFPLSIITGWYGMNFVYMPELFSKYGYIMVIIISVLIILIEMIIFKKKKFF
ncbi:MAG: CorA family divalent cation transporter [Thomasclavelia sp.]|uniref:magnesium transporter CorA family protein n=1 Tax=Thomasclavelia sp. TaxID=3025757 RepID=UPI00399F485F